MHHIDLLDLIRYRYGSTRIYMQAAARRRATTGCGCCLAKLCHSSRSRSTVVLVPLARVLYRTTVPVLRLRLRLRESTVQSYSTRL
eukprot:COSAG01_NODE_1182_length_11347_cov_7.504356_12_plen_86_part_00